MDSIVELRVYGVPAPKGSKRAFVRGKRVVMIDGSSDTGRDKLASWAAEVAREAENDRPEELFEGPIAVEIIFYLPKPKSAPKAKVFSDKKPDIDKLVRATLDSMTGVIFKDDGQVAQLLTVKEYATPAMPSGARIRIFPSKAAHFPY